MTSAPAASGGPGPIELDRICLLGLSATGHHGVLAQERRDGQRFSADVVVHLDTRQAAAADDLARTVNYAELATQIVGVLAGPPVDLVETLAQRIADVALALPLVEVVDVVVHKPQAPVGVPFDDVTVSIRRRRQAVAAPDVAQDEPGRSAGGPPHDRPHPLDLRPRSEAGVVLALGGNLGDVRETLRQAVADLAATPGLRVVAVSPLARTVAVGPAQPDYLNAVVTASTMLSPREVLARALAVEDAHGRVRGERWGPRTLDIDVIAFDGVLSSDPVLELPHPRARERAFVLLPWVLADPDAELAGPGGGRVAVLAESAPDAAGVVWVAPAGWHLDGVAR